MAAISVTLSDDQMHKLEHAAHRLNLSVEDLVLFSIHGLLSGPDEAFLQAMDRYCKNSEPYRRLA
jgi:hypothetical protein